MATTAPDTAAQREAPGAESQCPQSDARAKILAWSIGLVPVVMALTTWNEDLSSIQRLSRFFFVPVLGLELSIVILWVCGGMKLARLLLG